MLILVYFKLFKNHTFSKTLKGKTHAWKERFSQAQEKLWCIVSTWYCMKVH